MTDQSPQTSHQLQPDDPRSHIAGAVRTVIAVVSALTPDQYDLPTPCAPMDVAALAEHTVMALRRTACAGRDLPLEQWPMDAADVPAGGWADALADAAHDVQAAWTDDSLLERPTTLPWGVFPGGEVLDIYANELVVHAWDLASATGQDPEWDPTVLEASLAVMHSQLPVADRTPIWAEVFAGVPEGVEIEPPFANAVDVADDAPLIDRLVAWNGRTPSAH